MSPIEDELRRVFADPNRTPAAWPDATTRVRAGMRRRLRRRAVAGAVGATLAVLLAVSVVIGISRSVSPVPPVSPTGPSSAPGVVPWRDQPPVNYPRELPPARPDAAGCRVTDLVLDSDQTNTAAAGTESDFIVVHNGGSTRCTLSGRPTLLHAGPGAAAVVGPTHPIDIPDAPDGTTPATIDPGEQAVVVIEWYGGCTAPAAVVWSGLALRLAGGSVLRLTSTLDARCGVGMGQWYRPVVDRLPWLGLAVTIEAPPTVHVGQSFDYVVTLTNPTGVPVPLVPCPNYVQRIEGTKSGRVNQLNCAVTSIPAGGRVRFAMRMSWVAHDGVPGPTVLTWNLDGGISPGPIPGGSTTVILQR